jgi:ParB-like chromosome segregation protein Spo0J
MSALVNSALGGEVVDATLASTEAGNPDATDITKGTISENATSPIEYPFHSVTADYDDFTKEELDALCNSVRKDGLVVPIVIWRIQIVDGKHRTKACKKEGVPLRYDDITERCPTEEQMRAYVKALNEHRRANTRPLTSAQKRERIEAALKADPERSDVVIAKEVGATHPTVGHVRQELEAEGVVKFTAPSDRKSQTVKKGEGQRRTPRQPKVAASGTEHLKVQDGEPTLFDDLSPSLAPAASPAEKRDAAPPKPAEAPQPLDPAREHLAHILGAAAALSRIPADADFDRMAAIIDPVERERRGKDMDVAAGIVRRLRIALLRSDLERSTLPLAEA